MKIGLPKALLYYRYGCLWETFFRELGYQVVISGDSRADTLAGGTKNAVDENCLPLKIFMGHVASLIGRCDYILVPRFARTGPGDEYCVRFWGLPDLVSNTYKNAPLLSYDLSSAGKRAQLKEFLKLGRALKKSPRHTIEAYEAAVKAQILRKQSGIESQKALLKTSRSKVLIAAQPYLSHDSYISGGILNMIRKQGAVPLFSDRCEGELCRILSRNISKGLYWTLNKEILGAIELYKGSVDGIILLTAFPCGSDCLVNELVIRKIKEPPLIQILLDEHQGQAGLETRVESFMDIIHQRRACLG